MEDLPWARVRAPDFDGIKAWINSKPLKMEELRGKVVLVDFWTYSCINCIRTLPYLKRWHEKYADKGLVVIGVHSPEFQFEGEKANVADAVKKFGIEYPVALDSDMRVWAAYDNHYWPAKFLVDREGYIAFAHFGEGDYTLTEKAIQDALGVKAKFENEEFPGYVFDQSTETYAGYGKSMGLGSGLACDKNGCNVYIDPGEHEPNIIYPHGEWVQEEEYLELKKTPGQISYRFNAREVNVVMGPVEKSASAQVFIDGKKAGKLTIDAPRMYTAYQDKKYAEKEISVVFEGKVRVYAFTFG